jgi:bifunctional DNA-binding transcriptional regulator/antitoxin component of YhaV-PrlF toxin-antitoxin module
MTGSDKFEIRRVQALTGERTLVICFPKHLAEDLGVGKGDFLKYRIDGGRLIVEKIET